jgi:hypothetical protein
MSKKLKPLRQNFKWVYCPRREKWVAFSNCMVTCRYIKELGGIYGDNKNILCGWDNSVRPIVKNKGDKPKETPYSPRIHKVKRQVELP